MKKIMLVALLMCFGSSVVMADKYTETQTVTVVESIDFVKMQNRFNRPAKKYQPCAKKCQKTAEPVRLKTYTEVVEHYQILQPVTVYQPIGTEVKRYVVPAKRCDKCSL